VPMVARLGSRLVFLAPLLAACAPVLAAHAAGPAAAPQGPTAPLAAAPAFDQTHALWTRVLAARVHGDRVDYAAMQKERGERDAYVRSLEAVRKPDYERWTRAQQLAFWIDAYNAYTLRLIVDHYPVASIRDLGGTLSSPWKQPLIPLRPFQPDG